MRAAIRRAITTSHLRRRFLDWGGRRLSGLSFLFEIIDASTRATGDDLLVGTHFIIGLWPEHHIASRAFVIANRGQTIPPQACHAVVIGQRVRADAAAQPFPPSIPVRQLALIPGCHRACLGLLLLDLGGLFLQLRLGLPYRRSE